MENHERRYVPPEYKTLESGAENASWSLDAKKASGVTGSEAENLSESKPDMERNLTEAAEVSEKGANIAATMEQETGLPPTPQKVLEDLLIHGEIGSSGQASAIMEQIESLHGSEEQ